jgi:preprotein translocase subunit YajC
MELSVLLQAPNGATGSGLGSIIMIVLIFVIFYFFMIRPQNKKQRKSQNSEHLWR